MRASASLAVVLVTSGCLLSNPAYSDHDAGTTTAGGTGLTTDDPSAGSTSAQTTAASTEGSGSASDGASTGASTGAVDSTGSTGATGCAEESLYPDGDGDGYGVEPAVMVCAGTPGYAPQAGDCDDASGGVHPGAVELCDPMQIDEDCDGLKNESSPMNASCDGCGLAEYGGHSYWFCGATVTWDAARGLCQAFGAVDLVIVDDMAENQWIFPQTQAFTSWLGGRDVDPNAITYTWWNGAPLVFDGFALVDEDNGCIAMEKDDNSLWRDRTCSDPYGYVCESL